MKSRNLLIVPVLMAAVCISSCNTKTAKDTIIAKWHVTEISGKGSQLIPDSLKTKMYKEAAIEFKKDGRFQTEGMGSEPKAGTYQLTADDKKLVTIDDGSQVADTINIVELTATKMIVQDGKGDIKISFKPH